MEVEIQKKTRIKEIVFFFRIQFREDIEQLHFWKTNPILYDDGYD